MFSRSSKVKWPARFIVAGIFLALFMLAVVTAVTHFSYQQAEVKLVIEHDRQVTFLSAYRLQTELARYSQTLENLSRSNEIQSLLSAAKRKALQQENYRLADFDGGVVLLDNFGQVITSEPERIEILGQDWSDRNYFRQLLRTKTIVYSDTVNDGPGKAPVVVMSVPVLDNDGQFSGAMVGMFRLGQTTVSPFYASIVRLRLGQTGNTFVVDSQGKILFDSTSNLVGEQYSSRVTGIPLGQNSGAFRTLDKHQRDIVVSYAAIPGTPWTLVTEEDWVVIIQPVQKYINLLLVLMILGMLIPSAGLGVLFYLSNRNMLSHSHHEGEMRYARQVKQNLLPKLIPKLPGWTLSVHYQPSEIAGGGYYDFMFLPDGRFMVAMADISENGLSAVLKLATLRTALRGAGQRLLPPNEALECGNTLICPELRKGSSINCIVAIFDPANAQLDFASAGQNRAYIVNGKIISELQPTGDPLGLSLESRFLQTRAVIQPGESILFCSDGVARVRNNKGEFFGEQHLAINVALPVRGTGTLIASLEAELRDFSGKKWAPEEDLTFLLLERDREA